MSKNETKESLKKKVLLYKNFTIIFFLLAVALGLGLFLEHERKSDFWNEGFDACVEENNLYDRYK